MSNVIKTSSPNLTYPTETNAFLTATGITDPIQSMAINELISDLMAFGLWSKMIAIYPFIGGTESTHKFNLKDPRDLDAAFRLVFTGGWTHSATGALPNGTTGYADTKLVASSVLNANAVHLAFYSRSNTSVSAAKVPWDMGINSTVTLVLGCGRLFDNYTLVNINGGSYSSLVVTPYTGLYVGTRTASGNGNIFMYRNGPTIVGGSANTSGSSGTLSGSVFIAAANNGSGTAINFSNRECAFASIGDALTATDSLNLYSAIQKFQGYLNRAVI